MTEIISKKNHLLIRRGCLLFAGPDNPYHPDWWSFYCVNPDAGWILDSSNNTMFADREELESMWVGESALTQEEWFQDKMISDHCHWDEELYISGIICGNHDERFR